MAYIEVDNEQVWQDEAIVRHLIRKEDGTAELRDNCDNLQIGEVCEREFDAIKKEHCVEIHDGSCIMTIEVDSVWDEENRPEPSDEVKMEAIRAERNRLLAECDWTQLDDSPLGQDDRVDWQLYRQALRDLPETVDVDAPVYPTKP